MDDKIAGVSSTILSTPSKNTISQYADYRGLLKDPNQDKTGKISNGFKAAFGIRKSALLEVNGFNDNQAKYGIKIGGEDVDLTWDLKKKGYEMNHIENATAFHNHRASYKNLVRQHIGYGQGTMFHCSEKNRKPEELNIPNSNYPEVTKDILKYILQELPKRFIQCNKDHLGLYKSIQYPLLDLSRKISYDIGVLKVKKHFPKKNNEY